MLFYFGKKGKCQSVSMEQLAETSFSKGMKSFAILYNVEVKWHIYIIKQKP